MPDLKFMRQGIGDKVKAKGGTKKMSYSFGGRRGWLGAPDQEENSNEKTDQVRVRRRGDRSDKATGHGLG